MVTTYQKAKSRKTNAKAASHVAIAAPRLRTDTELEAVPTLRTTTSRTYQIVDEDGCPCSLEFADNEFAIAVLLKVVEHLKARGSEGNFRVKQIEYRDLATFAIA